MATLPEQLERLEASSAAGGRALGAGRRRGERDRRRLARAHGAREVIKVKSMATDEIGLNDALAAAGIEAIETDLAELIVQLAEDRRRTSSSGDPPQPRGDPGAVRAHDRAGRASWPRAARRSPRPPAPTAREVPQRPVAVSGANFGVAETGTICVVESEGNGRFCTTLPEVLVTVMGIEKVLPEWRDLEVMLQLLPRSSTGERMNPYTSLWTGVRRGDGPQEFHLVLLDDGRTKVLADEGAARRCTASAARRA